MNPKFSFRDFNLKCLHKFDHQNGGRFYLTPDGVAPSVSTIVGWAWPHDDKPPSFVHPVSPLKFGTEVHKWLELYFRDQLTPNMDWSEDVEKCGMYLAKFFLERNVDEVWGIETTLHMGTLYAGTADLVCIYNGVPTVIDYKTSLKSSYSEVEWTKHLVQGVAYALAFSALTGERVNQVGIFGLQRGLPTGPEIKKKFVADGDFGDLAAKWEKVLDAYHAVKDGYWYD